MSGFRLGPKSSLCLLLGLMMMVQGVPAPLLESAGSGPAADEGAAHGALLGPKAPEDDWLQFHNDPSRTGTTSSPAPSVNTTIWTYASGAAVNSSPAVDGSVVFIGSADGNLYSFNGSTGELLWRAPTGGKVCSSPAVSGPFVFIGSEDGGLYCFYKENGTQRFNYSGGSPIHTPVLVTSSTVVFGTDSGALYALSTDGALVWTNQTPFPIRMAPAASGSVVCVASGPKIWAFNLSDGAPRWNATPGSGNLSHPCIASGKVFFGTEDGYVFSLDISTGNPAWAAPTLVVGAVVGCPAYSDGFLYLGTRGQRFYRLDASNGSISLNISADAPVESSAAVSGQSVIFGSSAGLCAIQNGTGALIWNLSVTGGVSSSPAISLGRCYAGSAAGMVLALGVRHTARIEYAGPSPVRQGEDVGFNGSSPDCTPVAYQWRSDLDGLLSTKARFNITTLTLGVHRISFRIQDDSWTWSKTEIATIEVLPSAEWPMFKKDTSHRGFSEGEAPLTKTVVWEAHLGNQIDSSPVVYQDMVFIGTRLSGAIYALDLDTGAKIWDYQDSYGNMGTPACADGMVFICDDSGHTIAFDADPSDGIDEGIIDSGGTNLDKIWEYQSSSIWGSPTVATGKVIIPVKGNATIFALDEFTGVPVWIFSLPDPNNSSIWNSPAVDSGLVIFGSSNRHLYALDIETGREVWNFTAGEAVRESSACVLGTTVFFGSWDNKLYALDIHNGTQKWNSTTGNDIESSPAVDNGRVLFGSTDSTFRALDAETGQEIWTCGTIGDAIVSSPAVGGGLVFFSALDGRIYALNESTGKTVWTYDKSAGQGLRSSPALVNGRLYIGLENGTVLAFGKAPDLSVTSSEITLSSARPTVGQQINVTARIRNIGSLNASAVARITDGLGGPVIFLGNIQVPMGGYVDVFGNWTVGPGVHNLRVEVTNTIPYEANLDNNVAFKNYEPPPQPGWTMFKYGPERTSGREDLNTPNSNILAWTCETRENGFSSPVTAGSRVYQASGNTLLAFDGTGNGGPVWSYTARGAIRSTPAVSNIVVFGSSDGVITALNEWDGSLVWEFQTEGAVNSSPLIQSDTVYIGSDDGYLYSHGLSDLSLDWKKDLGGPVQSSPAYDPSGEMLVVGCQYGAGGRIYCLYLNGTEVWNLTLTAPVVSSAAIQGGMAYVGCDDGVLYALDVVPDGRDDGIPDAQNSSYDMVWMTNLSAFVDGDDIRVRSSPAVLEGSVYVGTGRDTVAALNMSTGKVGWHRNLGNTIGGKYMFSSPAVSPGRLFIGGPGLFALNTRNGATVWSYVPGSWVWSSPAIAMESGSAFRGRVYAVTEEGRLCAFSSMVSIPPVALISSPGDGRTYRVGEGIQFNASESWDPDGAIVNWTWDLGDGNTSEGETVFHNYTLAGDYIVNLTVKDDRGLEGKTDVNIGVENNSAPRLVAPSVPRDEGTVNDNFTFLVTYFDVDNDTANFVHAYAGDQVVSLMPVDLEDTDNTNGKDYYCETRLLSGIFGVYFEASDGVLANQTGIVANLTVTNQGKFDYKKLFIVEMLYAGRGEVLLNSSAVSHEPPPGMIKVSSSRTWDEIEITESHIDRWWWANITVDLSMFNTTSVNRSTLRIYKYNATVKAWAIGENAGLDLENNLTWANVTSLSNFAVMAINRRPVARLGKDITIMEGETAFFNASGSSDEDGDTLTFCWTFGDSPGKAPVPGDSNPEHKYNKPGRYTVTVFVSDGKAIVNATQEVVVKQKGGEQYVIVIVVIIILVVAIIFILPRGEEKPAIRRRDEEEFKKGMEVKTKGDKPGKKGGKKGGGPPDKAEEE